LFERAENDENQKRRESAAENKWREAATGGDEPFPVPAPPAGLRWRLGDGFHALVVGEGTSGRRAFSPEKRDLHCARENRSLTSRPMKILLAVLSAFVLATGSVRAADDTVLLNTLGYTTGQSVLLTHMAVGTLADAYVGKAYKQEQANTFVNTYINVTKGMKDQMQKLVDAGSLSKSDSQFVENTIEVLDLVLREAGDLKDYIASGKQADAQAYDSSRKKALKEIKTLLSIKD
jgi:hypothetical protein